jgi:hypothetical protein
MNRRTINVQDFIDDAMRKKQPLRGGGFDPSAFTPSGVSPLATTPSIKKLPCTADGIPVVAVLHQAP